MLSSKSGAALGLGGSWLGIYSRSGPEGMTDGLVYAATGRGMLRSILARFVRGLGLSWRSKVCGMLCYELAVGLQILIGAFLCGRLLVVLGFDFSVAQIRLLEYGKNA